MSLITTICTALPKYRHQQSDIAEFMNELFAYPEEKRKFMRLLYERSGIQVRHSVLPDYSLNSPEERIFYPQLNASSNEPSLEMRMKLYVDNAVPLSLEAVEKCIAKSKVSYSEITHLITVSCTGLYAPGLDIDIIHALQLNENIQRSAVNFMGCYAAMHALKQADSICKNNNKSIVLIVCVELCTLHFQKIDDPDNIAANLLFSDGAAATLIMADNVAVEKRINGLELNNFHSQLALNGKKDMAWRVSSTGFLMTLSRYIPQLIEKEIKNLLQNSIDKMKLNEKNIVHWAIHPGGKKILETIENELGIKSNNLESSYKILKDFGNMSSATILFVLKDIIENKVIIDKPEFTFAVAFGPGLTMEAVVLKNVCNSSAIQAEKHDGESSSLTIDRHELHFSL